MTRSAVSTSHVDTGSGSDRRGRILTVGDSALAVGLSDATDRQVVHVANLFDAMGELCTARPHEPIDAVLVDAAEAVVVTTRALQSLRRFDPAVQLVLVAPDGVDELDASLREQFDHHLNLPLTAGKLESIFDRVNGGDAPQTKVDRSCDIEIERQSAVNGHSAAGIAEKPASRAAEQPSAGTSELPDEPLGDVDLVDAVMNDPAGVRDRALALIAQQTGWNEVELLADQDERGIGVVHDDVFYGTLVAEAPREEVGPWAQWLGHWLALDASHRKNRLLSLTDELTGAWNRRFFESFLNDCICLAAERRRPVTVMVLDLDDFKRYNDTFGHAAGDEILRETVRLLTSVIRKGDRVCRIGGDEFAVVFADLDGPREPGSDHPHSVEQITQRFQNEICQMHFPKLGIEAPGTLSVSAGLATYPWDGHDAESLLEHADQLALESKRRGKNAITMGPGAQENCGKH